MAALFVAAFLIALAQVAPACGDDRAAPQLQEAAPLPSSFAPAVKETPLFAPNVTSLELKRSIAVRWAPRADAKKVGTVAAYTRVRWKRAASGPGCDSRWIEIEPLGWVCEQYLRPSSRAPGGVELPRLDAGELVPGVYGKVVAQGAMIYRQSGNGVAPLRPLIGSATVRRYGEILRAGKRYWSIGSGQYVAEQSVRVHEPSRWQGVRLGDETARVLPLGFALHAQQTGPVRVYRRPNLRGVPVRALAPRQVVPVLQTIRGEDGRPRAHCIGNAEWVAGAELRVAERRAPPPHTGAQERWIDVDLDSQVLVAYEGELPVYATLVASGKRLTPTATGVYRVWLKFAETDMNGQMGDEAPYAVATVPWTEFYARDFALHTAYWHDRFGQARSHGCINLSPLDARYLYFWSEPQVPPGWSMANGIVERPGSLIRVRSAADPTPAFRGYARQVEEARLAASVAL
jgi:lipoprotein-anchoring transpeptidase ErfK/SrfK